MSAVLAGLPSTGLAEVSARAALLTRVDRKYVLGAERLDSLLGRLPPGSHVLEIEGERRLGYTSTYLDLPGLTSYLDAAHKRRNRWKVRTRSYLDTGTHFLEVKTSRGGTTHKERIPWTGECRLDVAGSRFVAGVLAGIGIRIEVESLRPVVRTGYRRTTVILPGAGARATLDTGLVWSDAAGAVRLSRPRLAIIETKTDGRPCALDALLWEAGHRPVAISKYATGLAALRPDLPRNRWHRLLAGDALASPRP